MREYKLTRSSRKTIALYIRDGIVEVRAPIKAAKAQIDKFVASKEGWIVKRLDKHEELTEKREAFSLNYGDKMLYRGKEYSIVARPGNRVGFDSGALCFYMPPNLPPEGIKAAVIQIYKLLAKRHLTERVLYYQPLMGVSVTSLKINSAKTRWGSMSGKKSVNFSWRLILADDDIIDVVVVHELAHIKQMNHSDKFRAEVEKIIPDWREREKRLKELSRMINAQNWEVDPEAASEEPELIVPLQESSAQEPDDIVPEQLTLFD
ncbi:MAG: SprT family zinc-dependent metalloprotease [Oscillospiraceae bacterium]